MRRDALRVLPSVNLPSVNFPRVDNTGPTLSAPPLVQTGQTIAFVGPPPILEDTPILPEA